MSKDRPGPYSIGQASALSGIGLHMIDYLCRTGVVVPSGGRSAGKGRGRGRRFTFSDIVILRLIAKLLSQGISVRKLKADLRKAAIRYAAQGHAIPPYEYLCTSGQRAFFKTKSTILEEVESGQYAFGFIVDIDRVKTEVITLIEKNIPPAKWKQRGTRIAYAGVAMV